MALEDVSPALQAQLGPEATAGLLALLETTRQEWQIAFAEASTMEADVTAAAIERFEQRLTEELGGLRGEMGELQSGLRGEMRELRGEMHAVEVRLREEIRQGDGRLREEMRDLAAELREEGRVNTAAVREEIRSGVSTLRVELKDEMSKVRVDVADALAKARVEMMRWSFSLCVGQVGSVSARSSPPPPSSPVCSESSHSSGWVPFDSLTLAQDRRLGAHFSAMAKSLCRPIQMTAARFPAASGQLRAFDT